MSNIRGFISGKCGRRMFGRRLNGLIRAAFAVCMTLMAGSIPGANGCSCDSDPVCRTTEECREANGVGDWSCTDWICDDHTCVKIEDEEMNGQFCLAQGVGCGVCLWTGKDDPFTCVPLLSAEDILSREEWDSTPADLDCWDDRNGFECYENAEKFGDWECPETNGCPDPAYWSPIGNASCEADNKCVESHCEILTDSQDNDYGNCRRTGIVERPETLVDRGCVVHVCDPATGEWVPESSICPPPQNPCRITGCNVGTGACDESNATDGIACDPENFCMVADSGKCLSGVCTGTLLEREEVDECHYRVCEDPAIGPVLKTEPEGTLCDDQDDATHGDRCVSDGNGDLVCQGEACETSTNPCVEIVYDAESGKCVEQFPTDACVLPEGCGSTDGHCANGICQPDQPLECVADADCVGCAVQEGTCGNWACPAGTCKFDGESKPADGICVHYECMDGQWVEEFDDVFDPCSSSDQCIFVEGEGECDGQGNCVPVERVCDDPAACTADSCVDGVCENKPDDRYCPGDSTIDGVCASWVCEPDLSAADPVSGCVELSLNPTQDCRDPGECWKPSCDHDADGPFCTSSKEPDGTKCHEGQWNCIDGVCTPPGICVPGDDSSVEEYCGANTKCITWTCSSAGICEITPAVVCPEAGNSCSTSECDPDTGTCRPVQDGTFCQADVSDPCASMECRAGECVEAGRMCEDMSDSACIKDYVCVVGDNGPECRGTIQTGACAGPRACHAYSCDAKGECVPNAQVVPADCCEPGYTECKPAQAAVPGFAACDSVSCVGNRCVHEAVNIGEQCDRADECMEHVCRESGGTNPAGECVPEVSSGNGCCKSDEDCDECESCGPDHQCLLEPDWCKVDEVCYKKGSVDPENPCAEYCNPMYPYELQDPSATEAPCEVPDADSGCDGGFCSNGNCELLPGVPGTLCNGEFDCSVCSANGRCESEACSECEECVSGRCEPVFEGTDCTPDDAQPCTVFECVNGGCEVVQWPPQCDPVPCFESVLDPVTCECRDTPLTGTACDDGDLELCTNGVCQEGECLSAAVKCPDPNLEDCTDYSCNPSTGKCAPYFIGTDATICNDDNECTEDWCSQETNRCEHRPISDCEPCDTVADCVEKLGDETECRKWQCPAGTCELDLTPDDTPCDPTVCEGDAGLCDDGACRTTQSPCGQADNCVAAGVCNEVTMECEYAGLPGYDCDDGNPCTVNETCGGTDGKECLGDPYVCPDDDGNPCQDWGCRDTNGATDCYPVANDTAECDDGNPCTENDHCSDMECTGDPLACDDADPCTNDLCDEDTGDCVHSVVADFTAVDDSTVCLNGETTSWDVDKPSAGACESPRFTSWSRPRGQGGALVLALEYLKNGETVGTVNNFDLRGLELGVAVSGPAAGGAWVAGQVVMNAPDDLRADLAGFLTGWAPMLAVFSESHGPVSVECIPPTFQSAAVFNRHGAALDLRGGLGDVSTTTHLVAGREITDGGAGHVWSVDRHPGYAPWVDCRDLALVEGSQPVPVEGVVTGIWSGKDSTVWAAGLRDDRVNGNVFVASYDDVLDGIYRDDGFPWPLIIDGAFPSSTVSPSGSIGQVKVTGCVADGWAGLQSDADEQVWVYGDRGLLAVRDFGGTSWSVDPSDDLAAALGLAKSAFDVVGGYVAPDCSTSHWFVRTVNTTTRVVGLEWVVLAPDLVRGKIRLVTRQAIPGVQIGATGSVNVETLRQMLGIGQFGLDGDTGTLMAVGWTGNYATNPTATTGLVLRMKAPSAGCYGAHQVCDTGSLMVFNGITNPDVTTCGWAADTDPFTQDCLEGGDGCRYFGCSGTTTLSEQQAFRFVSSNVGPVSLAGGQRLYADFRIRVQPEPLDGVPDLSVEVSLLPAQGSAVILASSEDGSDGAYVGSDANCPAGFKWLTATGHCYALMPQDTWIRNRSRCQDLGGELASIDGTWGTDDVELTGISSLLGLDSGKTYGVGFAVSYDRLLQIAPIDQFMWMDGAAMAPPDGVADCGVMPWLQNGECSALVPGASGWCLEPRQCVVTCAGAECEPVTMPAICEWVPRKGISRLDPPVRTSLGAKIWGGWETMDEESGAMANYMPPWVEKRVDLTDAIRAMQGTDKRFSLQIRVVANPGTLNKRNEVAIDDFRLLFE